MKETVFRSAGLPLLRFRNEEKLSVSALWVTADSGKSRADLLDGLLDKTHACTCCTASPSAVARSKFSASSFSSSSSSAIGHVKP